MKIHKKINGKLIIQRDYPSFMVWNDGSYIKVVKKCKEKNAISFQHEHPLAKQLRALKKSGVLDIMRLHSKPPQLRALKQQQEMAKTLSPQIEVLKQQQEIMKKIYNPSITDLAKNLKMQNKEIQKILDTLPKNNYKIFESSVNENSQEKYFIEDEFNDKSYEFSDYTKAIGMSEVFNDIDEQEMLNFYSFLQSKPMLALASKTGKKIYESLEKMNSSTFKNIHLYRARSRLEQEKPSPFGAKEMFIAPYDLPSLGRFNAQGVGMLYTSEDKTTALKEIESSEDNIVYDCIEWLLVETVSILDLTIFNKEDSLIKFCSFDPSSRALFEYYIPNFIAQCAQELNFDGIRYVSNKNYEVNNIVFFDIQEKWFQQKNMHINLN